MGILEPEGLELESSVRWNPSWGMLKAAALVEGLELELGVGWWVFWVSLGRQANNVPDAFLSAASVLSFKKSVRTSMSAKSFQSCPTLWNPMDCSLPGSSVHGILQARVLERVAMPSSGDLPNPGIQPAFLPSPALVGSIFTTSATWEAQVRSYIHPLGKESYFIIAF